MFLFFLGGRISPQNSSRIKYWSIGLVIEFAVCRHVFMYFRHESDSSYTACLWISVADTMSERQDDPIKSDDVISEHEHEPISSSSLNADVEEQVNEEDIKEIDTRTFFFRHVTLFVKNWGLLTLAGWRRRDTLFTCFRRQGSCNKMRNKTSLIIV